MTDSVRDTLTKARALIADPKDWWGGGYNGNSYGERRCALTAIGAPYAIANEATERLQLMIPGDDGNIIDFNDTHTHAEVLALFDRAIGAA